MSKTDPIYPSPTSGESWPNPYDKDQALPDIPPMTVAVSPERYERLKRWAAANNCTIGRAYELTLGLVEP